MPNPSGSSCIGNPSSFQAHLALEETKPPQPSFYSSCRRGLRSTFCRWLSACPPSSLSLVTSDACHQDITCAGQARGAHCRRPEQPHLSPRQSLRMQCALLLYPQTPTDLVAGRSRPSQQPFPETAYIATRRFRSTLTTVPADFVFAAGRTAASYNHRAAPWTVLVWTERHAARVFNNAS
jgi:hypothetical protein